jgi:hypothetical protein
VAFGYATSVGDTRVNLFYSSFLFFPAAFLALWLPRERGQDAIPTPQ